MRDIKEFFSDVIRKPPILFPLVALFHLVCFFIAFWSFIELPAAVTCIASLWMLGYTICWIGVADLRKWGAIGYVLITVTDIIHWYMAYSHNERAANGSPLFLIDILFCFFIMFYFRRLR